MDRFFSALLALGGGGLACLIGIMLAVGAAHVVSLISKWCANRKIGEPAVIWLDVLYLKKHIAEKPYIRPTNEEAAVPIKFITTPKEITWLYVKTLSGEKYIKKKDFIKHYRAVDEDIEQYKDLKRLIEQKP